MADPLSEERIAEARKYVEVAMAAPNRDQATILAALALAERWNAAPVFTMGQWNETVRDAQIAGEIVSETRVRIVPDLAPVVAAEGE